MIPHWKRLDSRGTRASDREAHEALLLSEEDLRRLPSPVPQVQVSPWDSFLIREGLVQVLLDHLRSLWLTHLVDCLSVPE